MTHLSMLNDAKTHIIAGIISNKQTLKSLNLQIKKEEKRLKNLRIEND